MGFIKSICGFLFWTVLGLFGIKKKGADEPIVSKADYRNDEQEKAVYYFSDKNKKGCIATVKGCFAKKPKIKVKRKGCFPKKMGFVSDQEYDALVSSVVQRLDLENRGLKKLGFDKSQVEKTITFGNYLWSYIDENGERQIVDFARIGEDDKFRSNMYQVTYLFLTRNQLAAYQMTLSSDWTRHDEDTFEYHYKDITALKTSTKQEDFARIYIGDTILKTNFNEFSIQVPGDSFNVCLGNKPTVDDENAIQAMKQMIREKKA